MNVEKFIKDDLEIRVKVDEDGEIRLNAKDIANIIGRKNTIGATVDYFGFYKRLSDKNKVLYGNGILFEKVSDNETYSEFLERLYIKESLFYNIILSSKSDKSLKFQLWVCDDVLPSLRKNNFYINEKEITKEQTRKAIDYLLDLCDCGKISLGRASTKIFGNKFELKNRLVNLGLLDFDNCEFKQQEFKASNGNIYPLFVCNMSGTYEDGVAKHQLQVSLTNAGYIWLKDKIDNDKNWGK